MDFKELEIINLQIACRIAENIARKRSSKAWLMANLLIPRDRSRYLFLCYAYLRWVDNIIDDKTRDLNERKKFIEDQKKLLLSLSSKRDVKIDSIEEAFLYYFIEYALKHENFYLITELGNMVDALIMDVFRLEKDGIFSEKELASYIAILNKSMFSLVQNFLIPNNSLEINYGTLGQFLWYAGTFRDFFKDLDSGYINISREDIINYKINISNMLEQGNVHKWLKNKIPALLKIFNEEILILKSMPIKIKLFWSFAYPFYLHKIIRIKTYGYNFNYISKKSFIKEMQAYLFTLNIGIKTVFKIQF